MMTHSKTPEVIVCDNRGLTVRNIAYHRHPETPAVIDERITRHRHDTRGFQAQSADPRLHDSGLANFSYLTDLTGGVLRMQGVDNGTTVSLNDAAERPFIAVSNISTTDDGKEDRSQAVTRTWQYENAELPGRPVSVTEQVTGEAARITERFVYAGSSDAEKALNLAGQCVGHYDTAGLMQADSIALTGVPLSVTRRLLQEAEHPDVLADWQGADASAWNVPLDNETHTTLTTADATGTVLTTTDAKGNLQRVAYDVAGLLVGSWLTLKGSAEQVIVTSLTYSAAGQKLREAHGNGVVTTYTYELETQRLTGIKTERPSEHASGAKVLQDLRYEYDPVGNVLKVSNDAEETHFWRNQKVVPENTYVYDSLYQLVSATGREMANAGQQGSGLPSVTVPLATDSAAYTNYTRTYRYDRAGNLMQVRHNAPATNNNYTTDITVSDRSNRGVLSTLTENAVDVDALFTPGGQQKQLQPGQTLIWNPRNELLKVMPVVRDGDASDRESYRYDAGSQRILKGSQQQMSGTVQMRRALYLPGLELRSTKSGDTETESLQVITVGEAGRAQVRVLHWESGKPAGINNDQVRYSHDNLIGSGQLELDGGGNVISMEEYYPYGGTAVLTARSAVEADYKTVHYSGKERDATGLDYYGARYYQPWAGRWLSADPAGSVDGLNLFRMVRNNPVTLYDPDGLLPSRAETQLRNQVAKEFVSASHMAAIEQASIKMNFAVSFRAAGIATINALEKGAAAKGHDILEKTIKESSLRNFYPETFDSVYETVASAGILGYVGHWEKGKGLTGIYMSSDHGLGEQVRDKIFPINMSNLEESLAPLKTQKGWESLPFTGDYDTHDMLTYRGAGHPRTVLSDSAEEQGIIDSINHAVAGIDAHRPFEDIEHNVIRHGAQVNFVSHMAAHEADVVKRTDGVIGAVANPGEFPLAMVNRGEWSIINNISELSGFYTKVGARIKEAWLPGGKREYTHLNPAKRSAGIVKPRSIPHRTVH
nr:RHS repeat domain-containing protein [Serratia quinivorans]